MNRSLRFASSFVAAFGIVSLVLGFLTTCQFARADGSLTLGQCGTYDPNTKMCDSYCIDSSSECSEDASCDCTQLSN